MLACGYSKEGARPLFLCQSAYSSFLCGGVTLFNETSLKCAIIYDFDGTLAEGNCVEHGVLDALQLRDKNAFWSLVKDRTIAYDADEILTYMGLLAERATELGSDALEAESLRAFGKKIPLFRGVSTWFTRINDYAARQGIEIEHYIVSSGLEAMIEGCAIGEEFHGVFGCRYSSYGSGAICYWPTQVINYTTKTQYLFRINKGIRNSWNNDEVNKYVEPSERPMPFERMIFVGDGDTDIPSMKMVRHQGGNSIAVFDEDNWKKGAGRSKAEKLISEERANYVVPADYMDGSQLDVTIKGILRLIKRKALGSRGEPNRNM